MEVQNLVGMANRIGEFFAGMTDPLEAKADIASHIRKYWEPRMRTALLGAMEDATTEKLHPLVRAALQENRAFLLPQPQPQSQPVAPARRTALG